MNPGPSVMCRVCLDVIRSENRHDFARCSCGAIAIDGGSDYTKCVGLPENFEWDFELDKSRNKSIKK